MQKLLPAVVEGHWVRLRPVSRSDHPQLYAQRIDERSLRLYGGGAFPTFDEWEATELRDTLQGGPAIVVENPEGAFQGLVRLYKMNLRDGWGYLAFRLDFALVPQAVLVETAVLALDYTFSHFNFRKVYVETISLHDELIEQLHRFGFQEEVRLKEYLWQASEYADLMHLSLYRDRWQEMRGHMLTSLDITHAADLVTR